MSTTSIIERQAQQGDQKAKMLAKFSEHCTHPYVSTMNVDILHTYMWKFALISLALPMIDGMQSSSVRVAGSWVRVASCFCQVSMHSIKW